MATLAELRTRINAWLADRWPLVINRQNAYYALNGRYWQGLISHDLIPAHTSIANGDSAANLLYSKPSDQLEDWIDVLPEIEGINIPCALVFDVYCSPQGGHGWQVTLYAFYDGTLYWRREAVGPEKALRDQNWSIWNG